MQGRLFIISVFAALAALGIAAVAWGAAGLVPKYSIYSDEKEGQITKPEGVACSGDIVVVADSGNGRLVKFAYQGDTLRGGTEIKAAQMQYPVRVQIGSKGTIFVLDGRQRKILKVNMDGAFQGFVEPSGAPGDVMPLAFKLDSNDNIYILDVHAGDVVVLGPDGKFQKQVELPKDAGFITDLSVGLKGEVYVVDAVKAVVYQTDKDFKSFVSFTKPMKEYMNFPMYMTSDERGFIYLVDENGGGIVTLGPDGSYQGRQLSLGWAEGLLYYPCQMCMSKNGDVIIADRGNNRVQVFGTAK